MRPTTLVLSAVFACSCVTVQRGRHLDFSDRVVGSRVEEHGDGGVVATASVEGTVLTVTAMPTCVSVTREQVVRTHRYERVAQGSEILYWGAAGVLLTAVGVGLLVDSGSRPESVPEGSDDLSRSDAIGAGIAGLAVGGFALGAAGVNAIRVAGTDDVDESLERDGAVTPARHACRAAQGPSVATVELVNEAGVRAPLGQVQPDGSTAIDLSAALPRAWLVGPGRRRVASVLVNSQPAGTIQLDAAAASLVEQSWQALNIEGCRTDPRAHLQDCRAIEQFVREFGEGARVLEAQAVLDEVIVRVREEVQRVEEAARREEERRRVEEETARQEQERQLRAEEARIRAEEETARREQEQQVRAAQARLRCAQTCRSSCSADPACTNQCVAQTCR
jgi:hypothetical protein